MAVDKNKLAGELCTLRFYRIVLSWDFAKLVNESKEYEKSKENKNAHALKSVKNQYEDVDDYLSTFEPLLFEEVKAQIVKGRDEEDATEWKTGMVIECNEADGFHMLGILGEDWLSISQNDLLLLSKKKFEITEDDKDVPKAYAFALVEHRQKEKIRLRMHLCGEIKGVDTNDVEVSARLSSVRSLVNELQRTCFITKICSLSTIVREYVALRSISSLPFKDLILRAADSKQNSDDQAWKISKSLTEYIKSNHNPSQLEAIRAGLSRKPFVLIQGPPGTGKTQTILGLLSAILHATPARMHSKDKLSEVKRGPELPIEAKYNHWGRASPWLMGTNPRDAKMPENGDDGFFPTSGNDLKPEVVNSSRKYRVRVLVCAPSNSALDEIVLRVLRTGLQDENNRTYNPKIVRIGLKAHHSVHTVSMDYLVEQKLAGRDIQGGDKQKQGGGGTDKDVIRASVIDEVAIVFSTLSFSGTILGKLSRGFDVVVIDEAAQAVEAATLVPLSTGCKQVFLVGDPVQLPATVISSVANKLGYGMSLFKRFQQAGYPVQMLKTQYRMHPEIRSFPSCQFYEDALEDGPDVEELTKRPWHKYSCFGPFCFFDIHEGQNERPKSGNASWENVDEADFVMLLYLKLIMRYPELKSSSSSSASIAIISPYRSQVKLFHDKFRATFGEDYQKVVDINTVDGFQGREKDVAIFSCVRANEKNTLGFVADFRRMNVGITRAKASVLVVGSASTLRNSDLGEEKNHWKDLIESAEKRKSLVKVSKPYTDFFSDENLKSMEVAQMEAMDENEEMPISSMPNIDANVDQGPAEEPDWGDGDGFGGDDD